MEVRDQGSGVRCINAFLGSRYSRHSLRSARQPHSHPEAKVTAPVLDSTRLCTNNQESGGVNLASKNQAFVDESFSLNPATRNQRLADATGETFSDSAKTRA
jgi:hypothetical protein